MEYGTVLNFGKRYEDDLRVIFDRWSKLHIGLNALGNQKILKDVKFRHWYKKLPKINRRHQ
jgi:hypothetical protein